MTGAVLYEQGQVHAEDLRAALDKIEARHPGYRVTAIYPGATPGSWTYLVSKTDA